MQEQQAEPVKANLLEQKPGQNQNKGFFVFAEGTTKRHGFLVYRVSVKRKKTKKAKWFLEIVEGKVVSPDRTIWCYNKKGIVFIQVPFWSELFARESGIIIPMLKDFLKKHPQ